LAVHASILLRSSDRALGILNVAGRDWDAFSPEALSILTNVGSQMGTALERARLFDLVRDQRADEQMMLLELSNRLLSQLHTDDLMDRLVKETERLLGADACALFLLGEEPGILELQAASGWNLESMAGGRRVKAHRLSGLGSVLYTRQPLLIEDVHANSPVPPVPDWLHQTGYRGLAIAPLVTEDRSVGALVLGVRQPRALDTDEVRLLCLLANQATIGIENARLHEQEIQQQRLESELAVGQRIQLSLLPTSFPDLPGWECAAFYQAARQVGGDFYDIFELPGKPGHMGLVMADVADKGVPAALFMALSSTMIRAAALDSPGPAATLLRANQLMLKGNRAELFVSAVYGVLDTHSGRLVYANAGHNPPLWLQAATGELRELIAPGTVLGAFEEIKLEEKEIQMASGDLLLFFTDGVTEALDRDQQEFGETRLRKAAANLTGDAQHSLNAVVDTVRAFTGNTPQSDDVTLFVVRRATVAT
jgi:sigma-B regulation protein RsbU (phosphoserine phosphatase)